MDPNLIAHLQEIRARMTDNVRGLERLSRKMTGPKPSDQAGKTPPVTENLTSIVSDIGSLAGYTNKLIEEAHNFIGDFNLAAEAPTSRFG